MAFDTSVPTDPIATATEDRTEFDVAPGETEDRETRRWYGVTSFALLALGLGVLTSQPGLLLASAFGLAFAGYGRLTSPPTVDLALERTVDEADPEVGEDVAVTVTLRNESGQFVPDLRVADGVPPQFGVAEGSPRHATALRPGEETTFTYAVRARRGTATFEPMTVVARDASGATERLASVETDTTVTCEPELPASGVDVPLRSPTSPYTGRQATDVGGPGIEFHATREYRPGDPLNRIDWNRTARTGEFTTVEYRVERSVTVALVVDARARAYRAPDPYDPSAVERSVDAAGQAYVSLTGDGHSVGLAALAPTDCWLPPGSGDRHRVRVRRTLATHPALSPVPPEEETNVYGTLQSLRRRLPDDAQVILFSPLSDDLLADLVVSLDARGYRTTVISPDPTADDTAGHQLGAVDRALNVTDLRRRGVPVVDWDPDERLERAIARTRRRWSR
ncbi:DUF58 domain-containing protein [Halomicrobium salinisoli]|uniref:DUF58 domain-containing protein n=1 Tax=Halomicrobium salinisoli TaxID=2878391 RepID=UPI001CF0AAF3|nr:DUF58 domain-containing protein [Halomicrobium salinisoli]